MPDELDVLKNIKGSAADPAAKGSPDPEGTTPPVAATPPASASNADEVFKQKNAALLDTMTTLQKQLEEEKSKGKQATDKIAEIEKAANEAARAKMSDMEKLSSDIQAQQKQISDLLNQNVDFRNQITQERAENTKQKLVAESGLRGEFHQFVHGTDPVTVKQQIDNLLGIQSKIKSETLSEVPPAVRQEVVGAPPASPSGGGAPAHQPDAAKVDFNKYKNIKDFRDLASAIGRDPLAKRIVTGR